MIKVFLYCKVNSSLHSGVREVIVSKDLFPFQKALAREPKFKAWGIFFSSSNYREHNFPYEGWDVYKNGLFL